MIIFYYGAIGQIHTMNDRKVYKTNDLIFEIRGKIGTMQEIFETT